MSSVQEDVIRIIAKGASIEPGLITPASTWKELSIDSLDVVQIIFDLEDHFKVTLPDRDPDYDTDSVAGLIDAIEKLQAAAEASASPNPNPA